MKKRRVVLTGMGMITPLGNSVEKNWEKILAGKSGVGKITLFDPRQYHCQIAGEVKNFDPEKSLAVTISEKYRKYILRMDRFIQFALFAGKEAIYDGGLELERMDRYRIGVVAGVGFTGITRLTEAIEQLSNKGPHWISGILVPSILPNLAASEISIVFGLKGINLSITNACAASSSAIGEGLKSIRQGESDIIVAVGTEAPISPIIIGSLSNLGVETTKWNKSPKKASRPFDKKRDGLVLSEGAGALILEELTHAQERGAKVYAEIIGFAQNADAHHITEPLVEGIRDCMLKALKDANLKPRKIDYINAHATSTLVGDINEAEAIKEVFRKKTKKILVGSTKSMTGHLVGAAGAIEAIYASLVLKNGIVPPTINLEEPDCDFLNIPVEPVRGNFQYALSSSFAIGGTNAVLVFKRYNE